MGERKKINWRTWCALAIGLCLFAACAALYRAENRYPVRVLSDMTGNTGGMAEIPRWEDMEIYEQYPQILAGGTEYRAGRGEIPAERLGAKLADIFAKGWDAYDEDSERTCPAEVYEIRDIVASCAAAVRYEGTDIFYAAVNASYRPETLGQFMEDLDLRNNLIVNWASWEYHKPIGGDTEIRFEKLDMDKVWEFLLAKEAAKNVYSDLNMEPAETLMELSVSIPLLGYENISIRVDKDGFLTTNILETGKKFYIGTEHAQAFVDYVSEECDGYEVRYRSGGVSIPE